VDTTAGPQTAQGRRKSLFSRVTLDTRPLAGPAFRRTLLGQGTSYIGTMVTQVAVPVQIYAISRSSLLVGLAGLAGLLPIVVFGLWGGVIADAYDRRRVCLAATLVTWTVTLLLLAQAVLGLRSVGLILALVVVQSGGFAVSSSTRAAIVPALVRAELVPAANTLNYTASNAGEIIGPLIAGLLVGLPHGFAWAYGADAALFSGALYSSFRLPAIPSAAAAVRRAGLRALGEGLRFIAANPVVFISFALDITAMTLALPRALFPAAAATRFHGGVGLLYSSIAIGSIIAGLCSGWIGRVRRQGVALAVAVCCWAAAIAAAGLVGNIWLASPLLALAGGADLVSVVYRQTILQTYAPDELRGRLQGVFTVVVSGGPRLGDLRAGVMAAGFGLTIAWSGAALICIPVTLLTALAVRPFWRYRAAEPGAGSAGQPADGREPPAPEGREPRSLDCAVP
jgi:MFS family permease